MTPEQVIRSALWAVTSTFAIVASFIYGQVEGTDPTTVLLGAVGLVGLVGLIWRLVADFKQTSALVDQYQESLRDERDENQRLRDQLNRKDTP